MNIKSKARMRIMLNLGVKLLQHSEEYWCTTKLKFHMIQDESQKRLSFQKSAENISFCQKASGRSHDMKSSSVLCSQNVEERKRKENKKVKSSTKKRLPLPRIRVVWMWVPPLSHQRSKSKAQRLVWVVVKCDTIRTHQHMLDHHKARYSEQNAAPTSET